MLGLDFILFSFVYIHSHEDCVTERHRVVDNIPGMNTGRSEIGCRSDVAQNIDI
jgi:hypothetical protein